jgi:ketosteroid isomerase-like protein
METQYMVATSLDEKAYNLPIVQTIRQLIDPLKNNNFDLAKSLLAEDMTFLIRGKSLISGEHKGADEFINLFIKMGQLTNNSYGVIKELAWLVHSEHLHLVVAEKATRNNEDFNFSRTLVFEINDGKIKRVEAYESDQYAFDKFWS